MALVERDDFASGTSSASSKLVHGGLRYLRLGHFSLVREALAEVHALSRIVAPHLVRPLNFVLPVYRGGPYGRIPIRGALWSYAGLTGAVSERGRMIAPGAASKLVPPLRLDGLRAAGLYPDAQTDDARLCLANLRGAAAEGGVVLNRAELVGLEPGLRAHVRDAAGGAEVEVRVRAVVNAAGPWIDGVRRLEDARAGTSVTLSRGAHLVLERNGGWGAALTIPVDRRRVAFAVPWAEMLLLGTTDSPFEGDARSLQPTEAEEQQILAEAQLALEPAASARSALASQASACSRKAPPTRSGRCGRRRSRPGRSAWSRSRVEADDVPPHRPRRPARSAATWHSTASTAGRGRFRARRTWMSPPTRCDAVIRSSTRRWRGTWPAPTGASPAT